MLIAQYAQEGCVRSKTIEIYNFNWALDKLIFFPLSACAVARIGTRTRAELHQPQSRSQITRYHSRCSRESSVLLCHRSVKSPPNNRQRLLSSMMRLKAPSSDSRI